MDIEQISKYYHALILLIQNTIKMRINKGKLRDYFHLVRKLLNIVDHEDFTVILYYMYELHELYSLDETYKESLANADTTYLS